MKKVLFILGKLSDRDVDWMIAAGKREKISQGDVLIQEGQHEGALYIVLAGVLGVCVESAGGKVIARLGTGEIVGEMSFVDARPPSATVKALEDSVVLSVAHDVITTRLQREPDFAARFYHALAIFLSARLREMDRRVERAQSREQAGPDDADELDPNVLDTVHLAGARFDHMLKQLMGSS